MIPLPCILFHFAEGADEGDTGKVSRIAVLIHWSLPSLWKIPWLAYLLWFQASEAPTRPVSMGSLSSTAKLSRITSCDSKSGSASSLSKSASDEDLANTGYISGSIYSYSQDDTESIEKPIDAMEAPDINEVKVVFVTYPDECCPKCCIKRCPCCDAFDKTKFGQKWWSFRCKMFKLVEHKYFETFIIIMISASSIALVRIPPLDPLVTSWILTMFGDLAGYWRCQPP